jgi:predicted transcriptional regulator
MADDQTKVSFMAPASLMAAVENIAAEQDRTVSAELRRIIRAYVERQGTVRAA